MNREQQVVGIFNTGIKVIINHYIGEIWLAKMFYNHFKDKNFEILIKSTEAVLKGLADKKIKNGQQLLKYSKTLSRICSKLVKKYGDEDVPGVETQIMGERTSRSVGELGDGYDGIEGTIEGCLHEYNAVGGNSTKILIWANYTQGFYGPDPDNYAIPSWNDMVKIIAHGRQLKPSSNIPTHKSQDEPSFDDSNDDDDEKMNAISGDIKTLSGYNDYYEPGEKVPNEEDDIIRNVLSKSGKISSDEILDLYQKAKKLKSNKLMNLVKQLSLKENKNFVGKTYMKKQLLEYLVRQCAREVLKQINEADESDVESHPIGPNTVKCERCGCRYDSRKGKNGLCPVCQNKVNEADDIKGAPSPPAAGQGTADQPEIPKNNPDEPTEPSQKETPEVPLSPEIKGIVIVNPKNKAKLEKVTLRSGNDADIERELHRIGAKFAGPKVKTTISTMRAVKDAVRNPNTTTYLYFGKYDPNSEEIFLMSDKSIQIAKDESVPASELTGVVIPPLTSTATSQWADPEDWMKKMAARGQTPKYEVNENKIKKVISRMVNEILDKK